MFAPRVIGALIIAAFAVLMSFRCRSAFIANQNLSAKDGAIAFGCIALLHFAALLSILSALFSVEGRNEVLVVFPFVILGSYILQLALMKQLRNQWTQSPLFKSAAFAPFLGCVLVILIWWDEHRRPV